MTRAVLSFTVVLGLLALLVWALRRGSLRFAGLGVAGGIAIETATSLGERRSLAIVSVEGRRILIGLTPATVSFIADLAPGGSTPGPDATRVARR